MAAPSRPPACPPQQQRPPHRTRAPSRGDLLQQRHAVGDPQQALLAPAAASASTAAAVAALAILSILPSVGIASVSVIVVVSTAASTASTHHQVFGA